MPPTCKSLTDTVTDAVVADRISWVEDSIGGSLWLGGRRAGTPKGTR